MQNKAIEEQFQINSRLYLENLKLKRMVEELTKTGLEL
jgi:hypothetical protein